MSSYNRTLKGRQKKNRTSLVLLFTGIILLMELVIFAIGGALLFLFYKIGLLTWMVEVQNRLSLAFFCFGVIFIASVLILYFTSRVPLKPVNRLINAMNRLAIGDYTTRITPHSRLGHAFANHPAVYEIIDSFNSMAEELENTEMLRSDFINNFSHEFKTPIVSISGFAKLLKRGNLTPEEQREYLDIIEEESLRLSQMATNVLNMTKVENQSILTDVKNYNLSEQLRSCVLLLERKWSRKNLELNLDFEEYEIQGSEELLKEVWINLIDNAVKFTPEYGEVQFQISQDSQYTTVTITNFGSSIDDSEKERIFHKFYQADQSHSGAGNGIGLAIVKRVVDLHHGIIEVKSSENKTSFLISLPTSNSIAKRLSSNS